MKNYSHGYLFVGNTEGAQEKALEMAEKILEQKKDALHSHPDFCFLNNPSLSIKDARTIRDNSSKKSFSGKGRVFIIKTNFFTREACSALLKTFEEPMGLNYFFVITSSPDNVLETLRSRLVVLTFEQEQGLPKSRREFIEKFFSASADNRIKITAGLGTDKDKITSFLFDLEVFLRDFLLRDFSKKAIISLEEVIKQRDFVSRSSAYPKMNLEHLCFVL